jgi:integrase
MLFRIARNEWGWEIPDNPIARIHLPRLSQPRQRRLEPGEEARLLRACSQARTPWLRPAVELAVETAMRRGELLNARYEHLQKGLLSIPITKTGVPRTIPLTPRALTVIKALPRSISGYFLPTSANALRLSWERAKRRAMI